MPVPNFSSGRPMPAEREARLERERKMLEEGRAELRAGQGVDIDDPQVAAWLDSLDDDEDVPLPQPPSPGL